VSDRMRATVLTVSDRASAGTMVDQSGPAVARLLTEAGYEVGPVSIVPDEKAEIAGRIIASCRDSDLVVTTGGTGLGPRDVTPEATSTVVQYMVPGIGELMRQEGLRKTPLAALSRSGAGVRDHTLIVNVPGSVRGATESVEAILPVLSHALALLGGGRPH
jgi:molybdopterin adenylyltransferase